MPWSRLHDTWALCNSEGTNSLSKRVWSIEVHGTASFSNALWPLALKYSLLRDFSVCEPFDTQVELIQILYNVGLQKICPKWDSFNRASCAEIAFSRQGACCFTGHQESWTETCPNLCLHSHPKLLRKGLGWAMPTRTEHIANSRL